MAVGSWKNSQALLSELGKGGHKAEAAFSPIEQGKYSEVGLAVWRCIEVESLC